MVGNIITGLAVAWLQVHATAVHTLVAVYNKICSTFTDKTLWVQNKAVY
jgi:hypothetical protein